jgi:hypothetical protein
MEWSIFAIVQTLVIALGVSIAFWLRIRAIKQQNEALRTYCDSLRAAESNPDSDWSSDILNALDAEHPLTPLQRIVLEHAVAPKADLDEQLKAAIGAAGLFESDADAHDEQNERIAELEAQLAGLTEPANSDDLPPGEQQNELRALLRQFTQDSREMMLCIQTLEKENAALLGQLTELGVTPVEVPSAQVRPETPRNDEEATRTGGKEESPDLQNDVDELSSSEGKEIASTVESDHVSEDDESVESAA